MIKKIIIGLIAGALIFAAYLFFFKMTKDKAIEFIIENGMSGDEKVLKKWDESFLFAWAKAIKKTELTFVHNGKIYNVKGGKAI